MKIVVTGHRGFVGRHTVRMLKKRGHRIMGFDRDRGGKWPVGVDEEYTEPIDEKFIDRVRSFDPHAILHLAGFPSIPACEVDPQASWEDNVHTTELVAEASRTVPIVVFASTSAVSSWDPYPPTQCVYARDKMLSEYILLRSLDLTGVVGGSSRIVLRYFNVYGPGSRGGVIHHWKEAIRKGQLPRVNGSGEQTRDFIHVSDVARANCLALELAIPPGRQDFFHCDIGTGHPISLHGLLAMMGATNFLRGPAFPGERKESCAKTDPAAHYLKFRSEIDLKTGLAN